MIKQEIILFLYRVPNCPTEAEKIDFAKISLNIDTETKYKRISLLYYI